MNAQSNHKENNSNAQITIVDDNMMFGTEADHAKSSENVMKGRYDSLEQEELAKLGAKLVREEPMWKSICGINAAILIGVISFIYGFYA
jgi:hypothetical protein